MDKKQKWTFEGFHAKLNQLHPKIREKALEIVHNLMDNEDYTEEKAMEEAIKTATTQFPGKVLEAELESEDGKVIYEVEIVNATGEIREVEVDAQSGKILSSELEDQDAHEKGGSHKDSEKS